MLRTKSRIAKKISIIFTILFCSLPPSEMFHFSAEQLSDCTFNLFSCLNACDCAERFSASYLMKSLFTFIGYPINNASLANSITIYSLASLQGTLFRTNISTSQPLIKSLYYYLGFAKKFRQPCSLHLIPSSTVLEFSGLYRNFLLSLEKVGNVTLLTRSYFGTPNFILFLLEKDAYETQSLSKFEIIETQNVLLNTSEGRLSFIDRMEKLFLRISTKILFYSDSGDLSVLCVSCAIKVLTSKGGRFTIPQVVENPALVSELWAKLNTNMHNTENKDFGLRQIDLCNKINHLSYNLAGKDADRWDATCLFLLLRQRFNHTLSLDRFMGLSHVYLATLLQMDTSPLNHIFHDDSNLISGHGMQAKGFVFRVLLRSEDHFKSSMSTKAFVNMLDKRYWLFALVLLFCLAKTLQRGGLKISLFWLISELLEKGVRVRKTEFKIVVPVMLWSYGAFIFRQLYCSDLTSSLTTKLTPAIPSSLEELALQSKIPILSHSYDFLQLNYTQSMEISPESLNLLQFVRRKIYRVRDLLNRVSTIVQNIGLRNMVELDRHTLNYFKLPADFSVIFLEDDVPIFEFMFRAFSRIHGNKVLILGKDFPLNFPRLKSWTIPNSFLAKFVLDYVSRFYESGIYERLLNVRRGNRIITRFQTNHETELNYCRNGNCDHFDNEISSQPKHLKQTRWASFIFSSDKTNKPDRQHQQQQQQRSSDTEQSDNKNFASFRPFSVRSLRLVWIAYVACIILSFAAFLSECVVMLLLTKWGRIRRRWGVHRWTNEFAIPYTK